MRVSGKMGTPSTRFGKLKLLEYWYLREAIPIIGWLGQNISNLLMPNAIKSIKKTIYMAYFSHK